MPTFYITPGFSRQGVVAGFVLRHQFTTAVETVTVDGTGPDGEPTTYEQDVEVTVPSLTPYCTGGVLFAQGTMFRLATPVALPAAPPNAKKNLYYHSVTGWYWADTPTAGDDAFAGWVQTNGSGVIATSSRRLGAGPDATVSVPAGPVAPGASAPIVLGIAPPSGAQGATVAVTLTGVNFASGAVVTTDNAGITVSAVVVVNATTITANFAIAAGAATGGANVVVTQGTLVSAAVSFFVVAAAAPALLDFTATVNYLRVGNSYQYGFTLKVKLDAANANYARDKAVIITGSPASGPGSVNVTLQAPFSLDGSNYATVNAGQFELPLANLTWNFSADTINDTGSPSGSPKAASATVTPTSISALAVVEVGSRQQIPPGGNTYATFRVTPTFTNNNGAQTLTFYFSWDGGNNWYWKEWDVFYPGATPSKDISDFIRLGTAGGNFRAAAAIGAWPGPATPNETIPTASLPAGTYGSNLLTVTLGAPSATGATLGITNRGGSGPTQANIFTGQNSIGTPIAEVLFSIATPGVADTAPYFFDFWLMWTDAAGNPVNPGGVANTSGWQHYWQAPNDGQTHTNNLVINYPAGDYYLTVQVWGRSRNSTVDNPPFTSDPNAALQQWPGGLTYYRLHVGLPPGGANQGTTQNTNIGASILSDPSFEASVPGQVFNAGAFTGPGWLNMKWGMLNSGTSNITVKNDGGNSGNNYVRCTGPSAGLQQSGITVQPNQPLYVEVRVRSNNPGGTHSVTVSVSWMNAAGAVIGSPTVVGTVSGSVPAWTLGPSGVVTAPSGAAAMAINIQNSASETAGGYWDIDDVFVQPVIQQTVGAQVQNTVPASQSYGGYSFATAASTATTAKAQYGLAEWYIVASDGSAIYAGASPGQAQLRSNDSTNAYQTAIDPAKINLINNTTGNYVLIDMVAGGSVFSGDFNLLGRLFPSALGIQYSDGTVQTTAPTGGGPTARTVYFSAGSGSGRAINTVYQNTGATPLYVAISYANTSGFAAGMLVGAANPPTTEVVGDSGSNTHYFLMVVVLPGEYYKFSSGTISIRDWTEWR